MHFEDETTLVFVLVEMNELRARNFEVDDPHGERDGTMMRAAAAMTDPTHSGGPRSSDPYPSQPASSGQLVPELVSEDLVMEALPLIDPIARGVRVPLGGALPLDDLRSIGHFAILELVRRYDPALSPFEPYMRQRLRWAMLDGVRRQTHGRVLAARAKALSGAAEHARQRADGSPPSSGMPPSEGSFNQRLKQILREHAAVLGIRLVASYGGEAAVTPSSANPERATLKRDALLAVRSVVSSIEDERQRRILERHYFDGESLTAIASAMGLSKPWVSRLHAQAITLVEKRLRERGISR